MAEDNKDESNLPEDWSSSNFPTSAKPVFRSIALLVLVLVLLCFLAYQCSEHPGQNSTQLKKQQLEKQLLSDDQRSDTDEE